MGLCHAKRVLCSRVCIATGEHSTLFGKNGEHRDDPAGCWLVCVVVQALVEEAEVVYGNKVALDGGGGGRDELQYVDLSFVMLQAQPAANPGVDFIRGMDSKTAEYAQIRPHHTGSGEGEPQEEEVYAECASYDQTGAREVEAEGLPTDAKDSETES